MWIDTACKVKSGDAASVLCLRYILAEVFKKCLMHRGNSEDAVAYKFDWQAQADGMACC